MIELRRADERRHLRRPRKQETWLTFDEQNAANPLAGRIGALEQLAEHRVAPGGSLRVGEAELEIVSYVLEGALAHDDGRGVSGVLHAGEFQCITTPRGITQSNPSRSNWTVVFHIKLRPSEAELAPSCVQQRFSAAERRGLLCSVASQDGRRGSLRLHQDTVLYSAILDPGQHLVHELAAQRGAFLHIVSGEARLGEVIMTQGDGAGLWAERAVSLTAGAQTEILLLDLAGPLRAATLKSRRSR